MKTTSIIAFCFILTGAVTGLAYQLGPELRLTFTPGASWSPTVGINGSTIHVVWLEFQDLTNGELYYMKSTTAGITWNPIQRLTQNQASEEYPDLVVDGDSLYLVYMNPLPEYNGQTEIHILRSFDAGQTWDTSRRVSTSSGQSRNPHLLRGSEGILYLAWMDDSNGFTQAYVTRSYDAGVSWDAPSIIGRSYETVDFNEPMMVETTDGEILLCFLSTYNGDPIGGWPPFEVYSLRSLDRSSTWVFPANVLSNDLPTEYSTCYDHMVSRDLNGYLHITYWENTAGSQAFHRVSFDDGYTWSPIKQLSRFPANHPMDEIWGDGAPKVVTRVGSEMWAVFNSHWTVGQETPRCRGDLFLCKSSDNGVTWTEPVQISNTSKARDPQLFRISEEQLGIVWMDERDDVRPDHPNWGDELYFRTINFGTNEDHHPRIYGAGWWNSAISESEGGVIELLAFITDPDGIEDITRVELMYEGEALGLMLEPGGGELGFDPSSGVYGIRFEGGAHSAPAGYYSVQIEVEDSQGNLARWPYLEVFDDSGIAPFTNMTLVPGLSSPADYLSPRVFLGGYWDTHLTSSAGGVLTYVAYLTDDDGNTDDISRVELYYDGIATGILLNDEGQEGGTGDATAGDLLFTWKTFIPAGALDSYEGTYPLTVRVDDVWGNHSEWPFLAVWE